MEGGGSTCPAGSRQGARVRPWGQGNALCGAARGTGSVMGRARRTRSGVHARSAVARCTRTRLVAGAGVPAATQVIVSSHNYESTPSEQELMDLVEQ